MLSSLCVLNLNLEFAVQEPRKRRAGERSTLKRRRQFYWNNGGHSKAILFASDGDLSDGEEIREQNGKDTKEKERR